MSYYVKRNTVQRTNLYLRIVAILYSFMILWNLEWVFVHLNLKSITAIVFSLTFLVATLMVTIGGLLAIVNNWKFKMAKPRLFEGGKKPAVGIIIPTCGEPEQIVMKTVVSVINQEWPASKMVVVVSDDAHNEKLKRCVEDLAREYPSYTLIYHRPYSRGHILRQGEAKSGNLNSALHMIMKEYPHIEFIETRDADDLVGNTSFLSYCIGMLSRKPKLAFVQTIKQCTTHEGDPFSNQESVFYQRAMAARYAVNSVFPCGSGLLWRLSNLKRIGGFPAWNLVEDLQSGYDILSKGGHGAYLPIIGAVGQVAPEDIPNLYKQRGTWALDSLRIFFWKNPLLNKGLDIWQKLQFFELGFSYLLSYAMFMYVLTLSVSLVFAIYPVESTPLDYLIHFIGFGMIFELYSFLKARGVSFQDQWRTRENWMGLMPVFMKATAQALWNGPNKKPSYKVTRKHHIIGWYWKETFVQKVLVFALSFSILFNLVVRFDEWPLSAVSIFWSLFFIISLKQVIKNSWHGIDVKSKVRTIAQTQVVKVT